GATGRSLDAAEQRQSDVPVAGLNASEATSTPSWTSSIQGMIVSMQPRERERRTPRIEAAMRSSPWRYVEQIPLLIAAQDASGTTGTHGGRRRRDKQKRKDPSEVVPREGS